MFLGKDIVKKWLVVFICLIRLSHFKVSSIQTANLCKSWDDCCLWVTKSWYIFVRLLSFSIIISLGLCHYIGQTQKSSLILRSCTIQINWNFSLIRLQFKYLKRFHKVSVGITQVLYVCLPFYLANIDPWV